MQESFNELVLELLDASIGEILDHEDPVQFLEWARKTFPLRIAEVFPGDAPETMRALSVMLGHFLWDSTPLPSNGFKPRPMPKPPANHPCLCGSGRKYKNCCANLPPMPAFEPEVIWEYLLPHLDQTRVEQAIKIRDLPPSALADVAQDHLAGYHPRKALRLLEPLFAGNISRKDWRFCPCLNVLCDAYDALGWYKKKRKLLDRCTSEGSLDLQGEAWQRLATIHLDRKEFSESWAAFKKAQGIDPMSPALSYLEVSILIREGKIAQAAQRARFWFKQLQGQEVRDGTALEFLEAAAKDPQRAVAMALDDFADAGLSDMMNWLTEMADRAVPEFPIAELEKMDPNDPDGLREQLQSKLVAMGIPREQVELQIDRMIDEIASQAPALEEDTAGPPELPEPEAESGDYPPAGFLKTPPRIAALEKQWHEVFGGGKPFSIHFSGWDEYDPWEPGDFPVWMEFLCDNPGCFDSLDILDDLSIALWGIHPANLTWMGPYLHQPLFERARAIVQEAHRLTPGLMLPWMVPENRPALRLLAMGGSYWEDAETPERARQYMELLLELNPGDNHGTRAVLANLLLRNGHDREMLALAQRYPDDSHPELAYGQVLALFRLDRKKEAAVALGRATEQLPAVARFLTASHPRKPALTPGSVRIGGKDQAWYYREDMLPIWREVAGLMDWLEQNLR